MLSKCKLVIILWGLLLPNEIPLIPREFIWAFPLTSINWGMHCVCPPHISLLSYFNSPLTITSLHSSVISCSHLSLLPLLLLFIYAPISPFSLYALISVPYTHQISPSSTLASCGVGLQTVNSSRQRLPYMLMQILILVDPAGRGIL